MRIFIYFISFTFVFYSEEQTISVSESFKISRQKLSTHHRHCRCNNQSHYSEALEPILDNEVENTYSTVQMQYIDLPYPHIDESQLNAEKHYYEQNRNVTYLFSYMVQLEYINHYLFQGKQTFM